MDDVYTVNNQMKCHKPERIELCIYSQVAISHLQILYPNLDAFSSVHLEVVILVTLGSIPTM